MSEETKHTPGPWESIKLTVDGDNCLTFENPADIPWPLPPLKCSPC